jgi:hypothetical protein
MSPPFLLSSLSQSEVRRDLLTQSSVFNIIPLETPIPYLAKTEERN